MKPKRPAYFNAPAAHPHLMRRDCVAVVSQAGVLAGVEAYDGHTFASENALANSAGLNLPPDARIAKPTNFVALSHRSNFAKRAISVSVGVSVKPYAQFNT
jgi:hypothetical protein